MRIFFLLLLSTCLITVSFAQDDEGEEDLFEAKGKKTSDRPPTTDDDERPMETERDETEEQNEGSDGFPMVTDTIEAVTEGLGENVTVSEMTSTSADSNRTKEGMETVSDEEVTVPTTPSSSFNSMKSPEDVTDSEGFQSEATGLEDADEDPFLDASTTSTPKNTAPVGMTSSATIDQTSTVHEEKNKITDVVTVGTTERPNTTEVEISPEESVNDDLRENPAGNGSEELPIALQKPSETKPISGVDIPSTATSEETTMSSSTKTSAKSPMKGTSSEEEISIDNPFGGDDSIFSVGSAETKEPLFPIVHLPEIKENAEEKDEEIAKTVSSGSTTVTSPVEKSTSTSTTRTSPTNSLSTISSFRRPLAEIEEESSETTEKTEKKNERDGASLKPIEIQNSTPTTSEMPSSSEKSEEGMPFDMSAFGGNPLLPGETEKEKEESITTTTTGKAVVTEKTPETVTRPPFRPELQAPPQPKPESEAELTAEPEPESSSETYIPTAEPEPEPHQEASVPVVAKKTPFSLRISSIEFLPDFLESESGKSRKLRDQIVPDLRIVFSQVFKDFVNVEIVRLGKAAVGVVVNGIIYTREDVKDAETAATVLEQTMSKRNSMLGGNSVDPRSITVNDTPSRSYLAGIDSSFSPNSNQSYLIGAIITLCVLAILVVAFILIAMNNKRAAGQMKLKEEDLVMAESGRAVYHNPQAVNLMSYGGGVAHPLPGSQHPPPMVMIGGNQFVHSPPYGYPHDLYQQGFSSEFYPDEGYRKYQPHY